MKLCNAPIMLGPAFTECKRDAVPFFIAVPEVPVGEVQAKCPVEKESSPCAAINNRGTRPDPPLSVASSPWAIALRGQMPTVHRSGFSPGGKE